MVMFKKNNVPDNTGPATGYGKYAYTWMIQGRMNILRSRLLNLADSITSDAEQRKAVKGLIKDFCGEAYYPMVQEILQYLIFFKVIDDKSFDMPPGLEEIKRID